MFGLLQRQIFFELIKVFVLTFLALTGLMLASGLVLDMARDCLRPGQLVEVIPLIAPCIMPNTAPCAGLFASCMVCGRLAHDQELLALRAAGVYLGCVLWPIALLGVLVSAAALLLHIYVIPHARYELRTRLTRQLPETLEAMLQREARIRHPALGWEIHVTRMRGKTLVGAQLRYRETDGTYKMVAFAREAELLFDLPHRKIHMLMRDVHAVDHRGADTVAEQQIWPIDLPDSLSVPQKVALADMTWTELCAQREETLARLAELRLAELRLAELRLAELEVAREPLRTPPGQSTAEMEIRRRNHEDERRFHAAVVRYIDLEFHVRPAFALASLSFVLIGCPVGVWLCRGGLITAFTTCFVPVVLVYYPVSVASISLARSGAVPAYFVWTADGVLLLAAALLWHRLVRA